MGFFLATSLKNQRGSAVVFALGLSLLVVALSAALLLYLSLDMRRAEHLNTLSTRLAILEISEAKAADLIMRESEDLSEVWEFEQGENLVKGKIEDFSGRLNVNALLSQNQEANVFFSSKSVFTRFFDLLNFSDSESLIEQFKANFRIVFGASEEPAFEPALHYLYAVGVDIQQVNINATSPEVLAAILNKKPEEATLILRHKPFESLQYMHEILAQYEINYEPPTDLEAWLGIEGRYFMLETSIENEKTTRIFSFFEKSDNTLQLKWRSWEKMP